MFQANFYHYHHDYQGNIRAVVGPNGDTKLRSYYPSTKSLNVKVNSSDKFKTNYAQYQLPETVPTPIASSLGHYIIQQNNP